LKRFDLYVQEIRIFRRLDSRGKIKSFRIYRHEQNMFNIKIFTAMLLSFYKTMIRPTNKSVALVMFVG